jgi:succinyl-diaminopimelate desuccinylase
LVPGDATVELAGNSPAAAPASDSSLVQALRDAGELEVEPKQAWTNVADFAARDIPAVNFGPGATRYAHTRDEQVEIAALVRVYEVLRRFLAG